MSLSKIISYKFKDDNLLEIALTHPSISTDKHQSLTYEKLEFLGDSVLNLAITKFLIKKYCTEEEGELAKRRSALVSGEILVTIAGIINLGSYIIMTHGEEKLGGRENRSNLENCLEALIGALYLDGGFEIVQEFIYKYWTPIARDMKVPPKDPKTELQEWAQKQGFPIPEYLVLEMRGPSHDPEFTIKVKIVDGKEADAIANSKKLAERLAAKKLLDEIKKYD